MRHTPMLCPILTGNLALPVSVRHAALSNPEGLLRLRESIHMKIEELNRLMAEVDDKIENRGEGS